MGGEWGSSCLQSHRQPELEQLCLPALLLCFKEQSFAHEGIQASVVRGTSDFRHVEASLVNAGHMHK